MKYIRTRAKTIFRKTKIPGADYVVNQYVGCEHNCTYCYARFMCKWKKHGSWGSWVEIKENAPELVKTRINGTVYMSSVSDPYQPIEKKEYLTQRVLLSMDKNTSLSILTKSELVTRDTDIFRAFKNIEVGLTINFLPKEFEIQNQEKRINALKLLNEHGIKNYCFISPVIPELVDVTEIIKETMAFTDAYWIEMLNLKAAGLAKTILEEKYPESLKQIKNPDIFIQKLIKELKSLNITIKGIVTHHSGFKVVHAGVPESGQRGRA